MSQSVPPRWLILPPSADRQIWLDALTAKTQAAGLQLAIAPKSGQVDTQADLILTEDADQAVKAQAMPEQVAVLLSQSGPLSEELAGLEANPARHNVVSRTSELIRRAMQFPAERRFKADRLAQHAVDVFPDLRLHIPEVQATNISLRNRALFQAMGVYEHEVIHWSPDVLDIYARLEGRTANSQTFDVTGKPRFMAHGPYITMPAGRWKAVFKLNFSEPLATKVYRMDWGEVSEFSQIEFRPEKPGLYSIEMDWEWKKPSPCEIRFAVMEGIFDGEVILYDVELSRVD